MKILHLIMSVTLFVIIGLPKNQINSQNIFLGKFSIKQVDKGNFLDAFKITKKGETLYLEDFKDKEKELIKLRIYNKDELKGDIYKKLSNGSKVLGNKSYFMICNVPKLWSYNDFTCETGFFIVTVAGPINVYKNQN